MVAGVNGNLTIKNGDMSGKCIPLISDIAMGNPRTTVNGGLNMSEWEIQQPKSEIAIGMFDSPLRKVNATVPLLSKRGPGSKHVKTQQCSAGRSFKPRKPRVETSIFGLPKFDW